MCAVLWTGVCSVSHHFWIVWLSLNLIGGICSGIIEIVEEQRCDDHEFRLTCRNLDTNLVIMEAWFTPSDIIPETTVSSQFKIHFSSNAIFGITSTFGSNATFSVNSSEVISDKMSTSAEAVGNMRTKVRSCGVTIFQDSYLSTSIRRNDSREHSVVHNRNTSINLRSPLNYRCTGVNHCSFILREDHAPAVSWGAGAIYIKYACVDESRLNRWCNVEVEAGPGFVGEMTGTGEGFIRTPGYPHYYVGESRCRWRVRAPPGQRLRITFFDISLRAVGPFEDSCRDWVTVREGASDVDADAPLLRTCSQLSSPLQLESVGETLDVELHADSELAYPKRGVMFHYKTLGCVTPVSPSDGYLVYRDVTVLRYMCCIHRVFADTRQRERALTCTRENIWNDTLPIPECVLESTIISSDHPSLSKDSNMIDDIVIPSLLIAALFIGNAFIILIIYKYRKRKTEDQDEEFNIIPLNTNTQHSLANAV